MQNSAASHTIGDKTERDAGQQRGSRVDSIDEANKARVVPEADVRLTIYSCTRAMYFSLGVLAAHLGVALNRWKFVGGTVGGGFGGKVDTASETISALLALKAHRPVKWRWTREEELLAASTRAPWHIELEDAVTSDGWILGRRTLTLHDAGAYARFSPYGLTKHAFHHTGAYTIPHLCATVAHIAHFTARRHGSQMRFQWSVANAKGVLGFNVYAGNHVLNHHLIGVQSSRPSGTIAAHRAYRFVPLWTGSGRVACHAVLSSGQQVVAYAK